VAAYRFCAVHQREEREPGWCGDLLAEPSINKPIDSSSTVALSLVLVKCNTN